VSAFWAACAGSTGIGAEVRAPLADIDIRADALGGVGSRTRRSAETWWQGHQPGTRQSRSCALKQF
jgi:hypothetical protein